MIFWPAENIQSENFGPQAEPFRVSTTMMLVLQLIKLMPDEIRKASLKAVKYWLNKIFSLPCEITTKSPIIIFLISEAIFSYFINRFGSTSESEVLIFTGSSISLPPRVYYIWHIIYDISVTWSAADLINLTQSVNGNHFAIVTTLHNHGKTTLQTSEVITIQTLEVITIQTFNEHTFKPRSFVFSQLVCHMRL